MPRLAGIDLPRNKRVIVALQYIHGIGPTTAEKILEHAGIAHTVRTDDLDTDQVSKLAGLIGAIKVEGDLRRETQMRIKSMMDSGNYRGLRHRRRLPVRGQRTKTNARTRKGPKKLAVAGKKAPGKK